MAMHTVTPSMMEMVLLAMPSGSRFCINFFTEGFSIATVALSLIILILTEYRAIMVRMPERIAGILKTV